MLSRRDLILSAALTAAASPLRAQGGAPQGSLTLGFGAEPTTLDPVRYSAGVDTYGVGQFFEQLTRPDPSGTMRNWLAESHEIVGTPDKPIIDIRIRPGVKFHNGDPLTSADFEFSYQRLRDPAQSRWSHLQASVERFEIVDDLRFRLHFKEPDAVYVERYLQLWAMPKRYFEQVGPEGFARAPVGTGPWKFVSWRPKEELQIEAFADYWNRDHRPGVKAVTIKFIPEDMTRVAAFKTGAIDWIDAVPPAMVEEFKAMPNVETTSVISGNNLFLNFGTHMPNSPFKDVRVRQAAAHAINFDTIIRRVLFGQGQRYAEIGEGTIGYDPDLKPWPYDVRKARDLLRQAGFANGFDTPFYNLTTPREPNIKEMGEACATYLTAVGIRCRVVQLEYGAWINLGRRGRSGPPDMDGIISWMWSHDVPGDPGSAWAGHLHSFKPGQGWGSYSYTEDAEMDALVEEQRRIMDRDKRAALLRRIARRKRDEVLGGLTTYRPLITLAWRKDKVRFTGWPWPGYYRNLQEIGLAG